LYTGSAGGVLTKLANDGSGAAIISKAPLPARYVTGIAVDPTHSQVIYVSYGGFNAGTPTHPGHVFRSSDGGGTWAAIDPSGWDAPIYALVPHATRSGVLFAGTDFGVLATPNAGAGWGQLGSGFPKVTVTSLVFNAASNRLIAGTHGRSAFSLQLPSTNASLTSVSPSTGSTLGGEKVTVTGTGLEDGVLLSFGGTPATQVTPASATSVTAIVPAHAAGAVDVAATNLDGSGALAAAAFTYVAPPPAVPEPIGPQAKVGCGCTAAPAPWWAAAALLVGVRRRSRRCG
ncbi:MAG TPA: IPT/TIG domain-containing protein, partial [Myxococcaceae bacterium]|nr:IPT/TIG domain-containing protein [Myxococcaceae bacterium]